MAKVLIADDHALVRAGLQFSTGSPGHRDWRGRIHPTPICCAPNLGFALDIFMPDQVATCPGARARLLPTPGSGAEQLSRAPICHQRCTRR
jgi:hypothetical protein